MWRFVSLFFIVFAACFLANGITFVYTVEWLERSFPFLWGAPMIDGEYCDVEVWDLFDGDIVRKWWDADEADLAEAEELVENTDFDGRYEVRIDYR